MEFTERVEDRLRVGRERYGHGVVVPSNASKDWKNELIEELLDACVYAAADVLQKRGLQNDDENAEIMRLISDRAHGGHSRREDLGKDTHFLDLCILVANAALSDK